MMTLPMAYPAFGVTVKVLSLPSRALTVVVPEAPRTPGAKRPALPAPGAGVMSPPGPAETVTIHATSKDASTFLVSSMVTVVVRLVPEASPPHETNTLRTSSLAVSMTGVSLS